MTGKDPLSRVHPIMRLNTLIVFLAVLGVPVEAVGQARRTLAIDVGAGVSRGLGGTWDSRSGLAASAAITARLKRTAWGSIVGGLSGFSNVRLGSSDECLFDFNADRCVPRFPSYVIVAGVVGWEAARQSGTRLLVGPALVDGESLGFTARIDAVAPVTANLGLGPWAQYSRVRRPDNAHVVAIGVGLRL